jgi:hypothetical protein
MTKDNSNYLSRFTSSPPFCPSALRKSWSDRRGPISQPGGRKRTGLVAGQQSYGGSMTHWAGNTRKIKLRNLFEIKTPSRQRYQSSNSSTFTSHITTSFTDPFQCELDKSSKVGTRSLAGSDVEQSHRPASPRMKDACIVQHNHSSTDFNHSNMVRVAMSLSKSTNQEPRRLMR